MSAKFKFGDEVKAGSHEGKIISAKKVGADYIYTVEFDDKNLMPAKMDYEQRYINFKHGHEDVCPFCQTRWKITQYNNQIWKDCTPCNGKKEDLVDQHKTIQARAEKEKENKSKNKNDLELEFEEMLDEANDQLDLDFMWGI